jgi:hypothetical protein
MTSTAKAMTFHLLTAALVPVLVGRPNPSIRIVKSNSRG